MKARRVCSDEAPDFDFPIPQSLGFGHSFRRDDLDGHLSALSTVSSENLAKGS